MAKDQLQKLADELEQVMDFRSRIEGELEPIKEKEEDIRQKLLEAMGKKGYRFVKTTSGLGFGVQKRHSFKIVDMEKALKWAMEKYPSVLTVDKAKATKVVKQDLEIPEFMEETTTEYLSVRSTEADED